MYKILLLSFFLNLNISNLYSQRTIGLQLNSQDSHHGFTLFNGMKSNTSYLIDNCGQKINSWSSNYLPGFSNYILDNGTLLRTGRINNDLGILEMINWNDSLIWQYSIDSSIGKQHHDIEYLPNGNILLIVYDDKMKSEVVSSGSLTNQEFLKSEQIIEIEPDTINGGATIIWEWKAWDHIIQDVDSSIGNFGVISEHPEKVDINFLDHTQFDWLHFNAIDYNEELDQILVSVPNYNEFWIIDHSTKTDEARTSSGGRYGKGGDLLYRWGNPQTYGQGDSTNQKLFYQHGTHWIDNGLQDAGKIMLFNNRAGSQFDLNYSTVNIVNTPVNSNGEYLNQSGALSPSDFDWTFKAAVDTSMFSSRLSSAQRLKNGNTLICQGDVGRFFEINSEDSIVWEYINPVGDTGPGIQGDSIVGNRSFRCLRYDTDFNGFTSKDMSQKGYIESGSNFECNLFLVNTLKNINIDNSFRIFPNPAEDWIKIVKTDFQNEKIEYNLFDFNGKKILKGILSRTTREKSLNLENINDGIYLLKLNNNKFFGHKKIVIMR
tara:strand:- start:207 stop:1844 length:1638 start_codon:yes stop_codon:yes gene_type:complete